MDVDTTASLNRLRECNVSHNCSMLVVRNKDSMLFPIYIRIGVFFISWTFHITYFWFVSASIPRIQIAIGNKSWHTECHNEIYDHPASTEMKDS